MGFCLGDNHKLEWVQGTGHLYIECTRCRRRWNTRGIEFVPEDYSSWQDFLNLQKSKHNLPAPRVSMIAKTLPPEKTANMLLDWWIAHQKASPPKEVVDQMRDWIRQDAQKFIDGMNAE